MKFLSFNRMSIVAVLALATILYSCQKDKSEITPTQDVTEDEAAVLAEEGMEGEASFDDISDISFSAADEEGMESAPNGRFFPFVHLRGRLGPCAVITVTPDDTTYPKTITIDFGAGCWCADGKFRKGAIIINLSGPIRRSGSVMKITLRDFYLNRAHVEGTKTVKNLSANGAIRFSVQVDGGKVTFPNGRGFSYESLKYVGQIDGMATPAVIDDVFKIEGRSNLTRNNGFSITINTESPLIKKVACRWINKGELKIKINNRILFLNYGFPNNGDCDNKALLTWGNGNGQRIIILP